MRVASFLVFLALATSGCVVPSDDGPRLPVAIVDNQAGERLTATVTLFDADDQVVATQVYDLPDGVHSTQESWDPPCAGAVRAEVHVTGDSGLDETDEVELSCTQERHWLLVGEGGSVVLGPLPAVVASNLENLSYEWRRGDPWPWGEKLVPSGPSPDDLLPVLGFQKETGAYPSDDRPASMFTVVRVSNGPVLWDDLELFCEDGTGDEDWGGERTLEDDEVRAGNRVFCDGLRFVVVHDPSNEVLFDLKLADPVPPLLSFTKRTDAYPSDDEDAFRFTVTQVRRGPADWADLALSCVDGTGDEDWGGERVLEDKDAAAVQEGDEFYCDGSVFSITHLPTGTELFYQEL